MRRRDSALAPKLIDRNATAARHFRTARAARGDRVALGVHALVRRAVYVVPLADSRLHLLANVAALVYGGAALVRRSVVDVGGPGADHRADHRRLAGA